MPNFTRVREDELSQFVPYDDGFEPLEWMEQGPRFSRVAPNELSEFTSRESADDLRAQLRASQDDSFNLGDFAREAQYGAWQGLGSLGQQAGGVLSYFGADDLGNRLSRGSGQFIADVDRFADAVGSGNTPSQLTRYFSGQVVNQLPAIGVGVAATRALGPGAGRAAMVGASALQSLGGQMSEGARSYEDQGMSREDAVREARLPAALSGLVTGALTHFVGKYVGEGLEGFVTKLASGQITRGTAREIALNIGRQAATEGWLEELPDEVAQGFIAKLTYDPERTLHEIAVAGLEAGGMGTLMSGGFAGAGLAVNRGRGGDGGGDGGTAVEKTRQWFADAAGNVTDSITSNPSIQTRQPSGPNLTRNADGILVDEDGNLYDDYGTKATSALTYRNGGWVQVGRTKADASAESLGNSIQQGQEGSSQSSQNTDTADSESSDDIPFPEIDPENERIGLSNLSRYMGDPDEAPVPLSQVAAPSTATAPPTRNSRMVKVAAKILSLAGYTPEFSNQFATQFVEKHGDQFDSTGEDFRAELFRAAQTMGAAPVEAASLFHEDAATYEAMGLSKDEAVEHAENAKIDNAKTRAAAAKANADALAKFKAFSPQLVAEVKGGESNAQEAQAEAEAPQASVLTPVDNPDVLFQRGESAKTTVTQIPQPETFSSVEDILDFRKMRMDEERALFREQIGLTEDESIKLQAIFANDGDHEAWAKRLTKEKQAKLEWFFEESDFNKRASEAFKNWEYDTAWNPENVDLQDSVAESATAIVQAVAKRDLSNVNSDPFVFFIASSLRFVENGGTQRDLATAASLYTKRNMGASQSDAADFFKDLSAKLGRELKKVGIEIPVVPRKRVNAPSTPTEQPVVAPAPPAPHVAPPVKDRFVVQAETDLANAKDLFKAAKKNLTAATKAFSAKAMSEKEYRFAQKNFDDGKRSVARAEKRLATVERDAKKKAQPAKAAKVSSFEHPEDVLTWMEDNGWKIKRLKKGETHDYAEQLKNIAKNASRFSVESGSEPDDVAQAYNNKHRTDLTTDDFLEMVDKAPQIRVGNRNADRAINREADALMKESKQESNFNKDIKNAVGREPSSVQPVGLSAVEKGDKFLGKGKRFVATKVTPESVELTDGPNYGVQTLHPDETVMVDKRSLRDSDGKRKTVTQTFNDPFADEQGALGGATEERGSIDGATEGQKAAYAFFPQLVELVKNKLSPNSEEGKSLLEDIRRDLYDPESRSAEFVDIQNLVNNEWWNKRLLTALGDDVIPLLAKAQKLQKSRQEKYTLGFIEDIGERFSDGRLTPLSPVERLTEEQILEELNDHGVSALERRGQPRAARGEKQRASTEELRSRITLERAKNKARYESAIESQRPLSVSAAFIDANKVSLPVGYVRKGDRYVDTNERGALGGNEQGFVGATARAQGIAAARALVDRSQMTADTKFLAHKALDVVEKTGLDPAALTLELSESLPGNRAGSIMGTLIRMIESADAKVLPHEVAHLLRQLLPAADVAAIEQARLDNMPADAPAEVISGTMTTQQFIDANIDPKFYPFINLDEYLAHFFADKFAKEQLSKRDAGLMERIQTWLKELWEAIKSKFRDPAAMDRIYRDMVAGKYKVTPETGLGVEQERGGLQTTKAGAENELAVARDAAAQIQSGEDFIAQAEPLVGILSKFNVASFPHALRHALRWNDLSAILSIGQRAAPNATAQSVITQADPSRQADLARMAGQQVLLTERHFDNAIADGIKAKAEVRASSFQSRLKDMRAATILRVFNLSAFTQVRTAVQTALNEAVALLEAERGTDLSIASLEGQVRALEGVEQSGVAMEQLLTDMTGVLMVSPEGQALLAGNGTARDIVTFYRDIKRTANQPIQNDQLLAVASYLMNKMPDMRDQLMAAQWAKSPAVVAQVQGSMKGLMDRLKKNPAATIERIMLEREKRAAGAVGAEFLFWQTQKELSKDLESLSLRMKAGEIAAAIKTDPDWLAYRQQTLKAQTSFDGRPIDPTRDFNASMTLPDGTTVGIGSNRIVDSTRETKIAVKELGVAAAKIKTWLDDPANWNDTTYERRQLDLHTIETELGLLNLQSGHKTPFMIWSMSMLNNVIDQAGSRHAVAARTLLGRIDIVQDKVHAWLGPASRRLAGTQRAAMASHGFSEKDTADAATIYETDVFNELAGSHQQATGGLQVGDRLLSGRTVTAEDMAHLELSSQLDSDLIKIIQKYDRVVISDEGGLEPGQVNFRGPLKTRKNMLPRIQNTELSNDPTVSGTAKAFDDYTNGPVLTRDAKNKPLTRGPKRSQSSLAAMNRSFSQLWGNYGKFFVAERNSEFSKKTVFDGPDGAFALVADEIRQNPNAYPTFDDAIAKLVELSGNATPDQVRDILLNEFGRIVHDWHEAVASDVLRVKVEGGEPTSSFNTARGRQMAPSPFYRIGWANTPAIRAHASSATSVPVSRFVDALKIIQSDLEAQEETRKKKVASLEKQGVKNPDKAARDAKAIEQRNGHAYGDWKNLEGRIKMVKNSIADLTNAPVNRSAWDDAVTRLGGAVVGSLIANSITTLRNTAPIYHVRAIKKSGMAEEMSWMIGFNYSQKQALRLLAAMTLSAGKVSVQAIKGAVSAIPAGLKEKSLKTFWVQLMGGVINELGRNLPNHVKGFQQMEAEGLMHIPDAQAEFNSRMADPLYAGLIPSTKATGLPRRIMEGAALFENTVSAVAGAAFPLGGDVATNTAMYNWQRSKAGHNAVFGAKIIALLKTWQNNPTRTFNFAVANDPDNIISATELGIRNLDMANLRRLFGNAGMSFDAKAVDFMARYQTDPQAQFLTEDEIGRITEIMVNAVNRKAFGNEVKFLKSHPKVEAWISPLMHWPTRQFSEWMSSASIAVEGVDQVNSVEEMKKAQLAQWTFRAIAIALGMAIPGALSGMRDDEIARAIRRLAFNSISQNKQIWEHGTVGDKSLAGLRYALESVPFVSWVANLVIPQNTPARASFDPSLVMVKKIQEAGDAFQKLVATRDVPQFGFDLTRSFLPQDVRAITSRMDSRSGNNTRVNAINILKRYAPKESVRPRYLTTGANPNQTELSGYGPKMWNAAYNGDTATLRQVYDEALAVAQKLNKTDPVASVEQLFLNGSASSSALKGLLSVKQREAMLKEMGEQERGQLFMAEEAFAKAANFLGMNAPNLVKDEPKPTAPREPRDPSTLRRYEETVRLRDLMRP